jgi:pyridoxal phosphate enzyme (YggS family)
MNGETGTTRLIDSLSSIYKRISHAAMRAGRSPEEVTLIAVTKTVAVHQIKEAMDAGLRAFGENRVQEARVKIEKLSAAATVPRVSWHLIGHLQKNKAKYAVRLFDLIHSLDSGELAEELNSQAEKIRKLQEVLVEVKLSPEETKHGIARSELPRLLKMVHTMKHLRVRGLMTIPPFFENPEDARPYFRELRELRDTMNESRVTSHDLRDLSMGMSNDFEAAIEEGATMVRIGTALFGERK